jgi:hypothetical protein
VPEAASSGRISVATPYGQFLSTSYFIVVPIGRAAADIDTTARAVIRQNVTVSIRAPGHIAMVLFDGTEGERVDVVGTPIGPWRLQLMGPYGAIDGSNAPCGSSAMYLRPTVLPATGTYAIVVDDPSGVATGSPTVTVYDVADSTITTRTSAITPVTISVPGQKTNIEFVAIPGLPVSAVVTANGLSCPVASGCNVYASIVRPDGGYLHDPVRIDGTGFLDSRTITVAGVHTLVLDPGPNTGTATVEIFRLTRPRIKRWRIGHRAAFHAHRPGMNIHYTFAGLAGQQIAIQRSSETFPPGTADLYLANPDGSPLVLPTRGNIGPTTLPQTGTYVVMFDPIGAATGAVILTLDDCSAGPC